MKANDVVKGLECCIFDDCENCPHDEETACVENLHQEAIALINSYKAENERLEANLKEAFAEIEELKQINLHCKAETAKEFAKFLVDKAENGVIAIVDLPDYVREKVGKG